MKTTTQINVRTEFNINFDVEVKDGKVSWEDVMKQIDDIQNKLNDKKYIDLYILPNFELILNDDDDYYLGRENIEDDLNDEGITLED